MTLLVLTFALFQSAPLPVSSDVVGGGVAASESAVLGMAVRQADELCEVLGRASVDLQALERGARATAGGAMMLQGVAGHIEGTTDRDRAALADLTKGMGEDVDSQFAHAAGLRGVIMRLAVGAREWCGA